MTPTKELERVVALARRRGARVCVASLQVIRDVCDERDHRHRWHAAPFSNLAIAIDEAQYTVWLSDQDVSHPDSAGSLIHELAHLHAPRRRERIENADEWSWLGWEIAVAREAGVRRAWDRAMATYGIGSEPPPEDFDPDEWADDFDGAEWSQLTRGQRNKVVRNRVAFAKKKGLVDEKGHAIWRRVR